MRILWENWNSLSSHLLCCHFIISFPSIFFTTLRPIISPPNDLQESSFVGGKKHHRHHHHHLIPKKLPPDSFSFTSSCLYSSLFFWEEKKRKEMKSQKVKELVFQLTFIFFSFSFTILHPFFSLFLFFILKKFFSNWRIANSKKIRWGREFPSIDFYNNHHHRHHWKEEYSWSEVRNSSLWK